MKIIHSHKLRGEDHTAEPISNTVTWDEVLDQIPTLVSTATAVNIGYKYGERSVEFVSGDSGEIFQTRLEGHDYEMVPFISILTHYLGLVEIWNSHPTALELLFSSVCTYFVKRTDESSSDERLPAPRHWEDLRATILDILTCKKTWLH